MSDSDTAKVLVFPPLIPLAAVIAGLVLNRFAPLDWLGPAPAVWRIAAGAGVAAIGAPMFALSLIALRQAHTAINPASVSTSLVPTGVFGRVRNPMYQGGLLMIAGLAVAFALDWVLILLVPASLLLHWGVVRREELYLEGRFGDAFRRYCAGVPRYGWRVGS